MDIGTILSWLGAITGITLGIVGILIIAYWQADALIYLYRQEKEEEKDENN